MEKRDMSLILILVLQFTAAAAAQDPSYVVVRGGDDATFPCEDVDGGRDECGGVTWIFTSVKRGLTFELVTLGRIGQDAGAPADRPGLTADCALVKKEVTAEDVGVYTCRRLKSGEIRDNHVCLSVVNMTEREEGDEVTLSCSVSTCDFCRHAVEWLHEGKSAAEGAADARASPCAAAVTLPSSRLKQKHRQPLKCQVTEKRSGRVQLFALGEDTAAGNADAALRGWQRLVVVPVGLAALITSVVAVNMWTRAKGNKTRRDDSDVCRFSRVNEYEDEMQTYENFGDVPASVRRH